jgi:hypothetical protein
MVSVVALLTLLAAVFAVANGKEVANKHEQELDSKFYLGLDASLCGGGWLSSSCTWLNPYVNRFSSGCYGVSILGGLNIYGGLFIKAVESETQHSRRAVSLDASQLFRRADDTQVKCINQKGESQMFLKADCAKCVLCCLSFPIFMTY